MKERLGASMDAQAINEALRVWRQGDITQDAGLEFLHMADVSSPLSPASAAAVLSAESSDDTDIEGVTPVLDEVQGLVMLTQTCDVVRNCEKRPFVEVAPLVELKDHEVEEVRRLKRSAYAYIPAVASDLLVADLSRTMTVEKSIVARWERIPGWETDKEIRDFVRAISRKRSRFAFPDDFVRALQPFQRHFAKQHGKRSEEGAHLRALREIRIRAAPSWNHDEVEINWWLIKDDEPQGYDPNWDELTESWLQLIKPVGGFRFELPVVCTLSDLTAQEYVESDPLDLDQLSTS